MGSSPLARGPQVQMLPLQTGHRLIPARAGTTTSALADEMYGRAHPRSRGDHAATLFRFGSRSGSSPLARGPLWGGEQHGDVAGLIPARAGTTFQEIPRRAGHRAHPRSRGDHTC